MRALVFSGDERYEEIIHFLKTRGIEVDHAKDDSMFDSSRQINVSVYDLIIFPIPGISNAFFAGAALLSPDFLCNSKEDVLIFSGIKTPCLSQLLEIGNRTCIYFMEDKMVAEKNAIPTVEGIIADLILNTKITIHQADIMVLGYGKVGRPLVQALVCMGANVCVGVEKLEDIKSLERLGIHGFYTKTKLMKRYTKMAEMVINTVPSLVLKEEHIVKMNKQAYVLDVASYPYGIDQEALKQNDITYKIYPKIPSKVAPRTAGKILAEKIETVIRGTKTE